MEHPQARERSAHEEYTPTLYVAPRKQSSPLDKSALLAYFTWRLLLPPDPPPSSWRCHCRRASNRSLSARTNHSRLSLRQSAPSSCRSSTSPPSNLAAPRSPSLEPTMPPQHASLKTKWLTKSARRCLASEGRSLCPWTSSNLASALRSGGVETRRLTV